MKRYEAVQAIWDELLKHHEEAFGWANGSWDKTGYKLIDRPADFDYEAWKEKVARLEKLHDFILHLEDALRRLEKLDASAAIRICFESPAYAGNNATLTLQNARLIYKWGYRYRDLAARYVPVETTEPLAEDQLRKKQKEELAKLGTHVALGVMMRVVEDELEKARAHLGWLEEEVGEGE